MLRLYLPRSVKIAGGTPFLPNLFGRYFDAAEFSVVRERDDSIRLILLPCVNPYRLSRKLAAIKGQNMFAYDALADADREALREGRKKLVLDMGSEMFFSRPDMIDGMHEGLAEIGLGRSHLLILNGDANAELNYREYCKASNIPDPVSILMTNANPLFFLAHQRMTPAAFGEYEASSRQRRQKARAKKVFVNFNGRSRSHRLYTVLLLMAYGLMDSGLVSLLDYSAAEAGSGTRRRDPGQVAEAAAQLRSSLARWPKADICLPHAEALLGRLPLELDLSAAESVVNKRYGHVTPWEMQDLDLYHRSYVSLVTDSLLPNDNLLFVTEKVFKSIVAFHPFIYIGCCRALERLRTLGFQTFHPLIDESYDAEPNGAARLVKAVDELRRLASLPETALEELYHRLWPRLLHNARHACVDASVWAKARLEAEIRQRLLQFGDAA